VCASTLTDAACAALLDAAQISHPLDMSYDSLHADIVPVSSSDDDFRMVSRYLVNTHGPTHNGFTMSLHQLFKVRRGGRALHQAAQSTAAVAWLEDDKLCGHPVTGARAVCCALLCRCVARRGVCCSYRRDGCGCVCVQGLRIAPPEAPATGYMFGRACYFADVVCGACAGRRGGWYVPH
jgi:poly [ADP-ribose] polymerase